MTNTEYIARYDLLPKGSRILCALSGGRDSVYLLHKLLAWSEDYELTVCAAHLNHQLRGEESHRDEAFVRSLCAALQVPLMAARADVRSYAKEQGMGMEEAARACRYAFLQKAAAEMDCDLIATAHNADDLAETMLLQMARGAGTKGLSGIPPRRGNVVRPILLTTRREIDGYLQEQGIAFVEDSTNALTDCSRNLIRHEVMPILRQVNAAFVEHAAQSAMLLRRDEAFLQGLADGFLAEHPAEQGIPGGALLALDEAVASRVIRSVWQGAEYRHVQEILALCHGSGLKTLHVPGGVVRYDGGRLWDTTAAVVPAEPVRFDEKGEAVFGTYKFTRKEGIYSPEIHNSFNTFCLKYENIIGTIMLSSKADGDKIKLQGSRHTKSLKKLFLERKLTQPQRAAVPVLRDEAGVVAVIGYGIAQRCAAEYGEKVIIIQWEN